ncbi:NrtA/SsuA/CpmA family ABC transporter substrate-binding protein [uncultured Cohaesibacter sp.]|uniref:ABC transporter substrate-binding protein n=1 Tax=uncultured Cohaesibacter sp. TaxID=1002546 RepID=UPI0029C8D55F|nr:NrtA/SsuA/CpmA family ABC transporter substrate-binding protein [uncultured Cohaesibacter sp.]
MLKSLQTGIAALSAAAFGLALSAAAAVADEVKEINVSYVTSPFNLQVMVTKLQGRLEKEFEKDGITINWHEITSGAKQAQALAAGSLDFGMVMNSTSVLMAAAAGNPIKIVSAVSRPSETFALVAAKDGPNSVAELKGKTVAGPKGTVLHQMLVAAIAKAGLEQSDVNFVSMDLPKARAAMLSGNVDASLLAASLVIKSEEEGAHVITTAKGLVTPKLVLAARPDFVTEHPDLVARVIKVHKEAQSYIDANRAEAIALGAREQNISVEDATKLADWAGFTTSLDQDDLASMKDDMDFLIANDLIKGPVDISDVVAPSAME